MKSQRVFFTVATISSSHVWRSQERLPFREYQLRAWRWEGRFMNIEWRSGPVELLIRASGFQLKAAYPFRLRQLDRFCCKQICALRLRCAGDVRCSSYP